jgi:hypothetical protein
VQEERGVAAESLRDLGVTLDAARVQIIAVIGDAASGVPRRAPANDALTGDRAKAPPKGARPASVGLILRYSNGAVVTQTFSTTGEAVNFLSAQ